VHRVSAFPRCAVLRAALSPPRAVLVSSAGLAGDPPGLPRCDLPL